MDHFATVRPGETRRLPYIVRVDGTTVEIMCPVSSVRLVAELWFPDFDHLDAFLATKRTQWELLQNKGRITFWCKPDTCDAIPVQDVPPTNLRKTKTAKQLGVTMDELTYAGRIALKAIIRIHRSRK